ncbi:unnamed protein product [Sphagnum balticum]
MQQGVRAVEAYRRAVLVDGVTADNDIIVPVYKLEEICALLRSSPLDIVREVLERILKRLNHKSPLVKQKALRLIKFAVGKAGPEFRREIQRQAPAVRTLTHYRGQPDALKGDALNKAVRDTAQDAVSAIFASDEKTSAIEEAGRRTQGFGSTNYDMPPQGEKKTIFNGMIGFGSASMLQRSGSGNSISFNTNSSSYRGHELQGSLASSDQESKYDSTDSPSSPPFDPRAQQVEHNNGRGSHGLGKKNSQEERLVDVVTTPGGVRLQPSRDAMQTFLSAAVKLDTERLGHALEAKLQDHSWQVRLKAICTVEALLRQRGSSKVFDKVGAMFGEDAVAIFECAQSPQASLREKSKKLLHLLGLGSQDEDEKPQGTLGFIPPPPGSTLAPAPPAPIQVPDLIDTWDDGTPGPSDESANASLFSHQEEVSGSKSTVPPSVSAAPVDVFVEFQWFESPADVVKSTEVGDPFFTKSQDASRSSLTPDLFSGLTLDTIFSGLTVSNGESAASAKQHSSLDSLADLMGGLSTDVPISVSDTFQSLSASATTTQQPMRIPAPSLGNHSGLSHGSFIPTLRTEARPMGIPPPQGGRGLPQQMMYMNPAVLMAMAGSGLAPNVLLQQSLASGAPGYVSINAGFMQQHLAPGFESVQRHGMGMDIGAGGGLQGGSLGHGSGLGHSFNDGFDFSSNAAPNYVSTAETKKEETKAFDFLKDHVTSALGSKTVK